MPSPPPRPPLDPAAPALVLAPHLRYPTRNGGDVAIDRVARYLSAEVPYVDVIAEHEAIRYTATEEVHRSSFTNTMRRAPVAALRTLAFHSHYLQERYVRPSYLDQARPYLRDTRYGTVVSSFACVAALLPSQGLWPDGRTHLLITHNDQLRWFRNMRETVRNPLAKLVALYSERWYRPFYERYGQDFVSIYFTESDLQGHREALGDHPSYVMPIGVDIPAPTPPPPQPGAGTPVRLIFVGALGLTMNYDALAHFDHTFYPVLQAVLGCGFEVMVVGSTPTARVEELCSRNGWHLHADVSDEELRRLYASAHFALLPFPYTTGAKLKLLSAFACGVSVLATATIGGQLRDPLPAPSLVSDDPEAWARRVLAIADGSLHNDPDVLRNYARRYAWPAVTSRMTDDIRRLLSTPCPV